MARAGYRAHQVALGEVLDEVRASALGADLLVLDPGRVRHPRPPGRLGRTPSLSTFPRPPGQPSVAAPGSAPVRGGEAGSAAGSAAQAGVQSGTPGGEGGGGWRQWRV